MRLWSLHPRYLDAKGLLACWREGLLARKVLQGRTRGYRNHPQLTRFKGQADPLGSIDTYLQAVLEEAASRGYHFDPLKIGPTFTHEKIAVTDGQLRYELEHLRNKLSVRAPQKNAEIARVTDPEAHPLFRVVPGEVEAWERLLPGKAAQEECGDPSQWKG